MNFAPLLYFIPGRPGLPECIPEHRRDSLRTKSTVGAIGVPEDGKQQRGQLFSMFSDCHLEYLPDRQRWLPFSHGDIKYYIGIDKDVHPDLFKRKTTIPGSLVQFHYGFFEIPVANPLVDSCTLPYTEIPGPEGQWIKDYLEEYKECSDRAIELAAAAREFYLESLESETVNFEMEDNDFRELVRVMVGVNYDLTLEEMALLRLFDPKKYMELLFAFVDLPAMLALMRAEAEEANANRNPMVGPLVGKDTDSGGSE